MELIGRIAAGISSISVILGVIIKLWISVRKMNDALKCMLRSQILEIYFDHKDERKIPQMGFENVSYLYAAYKALGGNSFVDKVFSDIKTWEVEL